ncbi:MAG: cold-shock protein [Nitriliruptoraceae bacterium]
MPTGHVKVFHPDRGFGFIIAEDAQQVYVPASAVSGDTLRSGDEVEFEIGEGEDGRRAAQNVVVTKAAPAHNPVGRTMAAPPSWEELEEQERQRRMARRRRR